MSDFDVAVIGGGPAGAVAALTLARGGKSVVLLDRERPTGRRLGESLPGAARPLLEHLGLLSVVEKGGHIRSVGNCAAWGSERLEMQDFIRDPRGAGWHLDRARFDAQLRQVAGEAGAEIRVSSVASVSRQPDGWRIHLGRGRGRKASGLQARWIVNATGRSALLSRLLGATSRRDDDLIAVYAWVPASRSDREERTLVEAAPEGWWYTSRLPDHSRVLVFHTRPETARELMRSRLEFKRRLLDTTHVAPLVRARKRLPLRAAATSACGTRLDAIWGPRWIAAGDAAMAFDPLSSQGIFNALYSGMRAGEAVTCALNGDPSALPAYGARLELIRKAYVEHRRQYYSQERRWSDAPFWKGIAQHAN